MAIELTLALMGLGWSGLLGLLGAVATGGMVPGRWRERAEQWEAAFDREKENSDRQQALLDRAQLSTEISVKVSEAVMAAVRGNGGGKGEHHGA